MHFKFFAILLILIIGVLSDNEDEEVFIPTSEWKEIKKGQKIPAGLHIRINLQSGKREAKLPSEVKEEQSLTVSKGLINDPSLQNIPLAELEETLKKIKNDENQGSVMFEKKFRSYEEIKKELGTLKLTPKLDSEIIKELVGDYDHEIIGRKNNTRMRKIMEDLEFLSHQIDNAIEFVNQNGFKKVIYKSLNVTNDELRVTTLRLMSSLMQNNPKVQIHGLETGCVGELLKILSLDKNIDVKYQAVGGLSAILRRFPLAQKKFIENGGLSVISGIFKDDNIKINVRLTTLVVDLVNEHQQSIINNNKEALKQYELINLEKKLIDHNWCKIMNELLFTLVSTDEDNHDFIEKCLKSMTVLSKSCAYSYDDKILSYLFRKYNILALKDVEEDEENSSSNYFSELKELCDNLIKLNKIHMKTEL